MSGELGGGLLEGTTQAGHAEIIIEVSDQDLLSQDADIIQALHLPDEHPDMSGGTVDFDEAVRSRVCPALNRMGPMALTACRAEAARVSTSDPSAIAARIQQLATKDRQMKAARRSDPPVERPEKASAKESDHAPELPVQSATVTSPHISVGPAEHIPVASMEPDMRLGPTEVNNYILEQPDPLSDDTEPVNADVAIARPLISQSSYHSLEASTPQVEDDRQIVPDLELDAPFVLGDEINIDTFDGMTHQVVELPTGPMTKPFTLGQEVTATAFDEHVLEAQVEFAILGINEMVEDKALTALNEAVHQREEVQPFSERLDVFIASAVKPARQEHVEKLILGIYTALESKTLCLELDTTEAVVDRSFDKEVLYKTVERLMFELTGAMPALEQIEQCIALIRLELNRRPMEVDLPSLLGADIHETRGGLAAVAGYLRYFIDPKYIGRVILDNPKSFA